VLLINCCWSSLNHWLSLNNIAPSNVFSTLIHHLIIFHCPLADLNTACFPFRIHCIAPRWSTFQGMSRNIDVILVKDFANSIDVLLVWQSSLFWNQISYFNAHVYSNLIVEMKSERCQFWKVFLEIKLVWSKIQHTLFNVVLWLPCILNTEMTRCKIKMTFSWFFVSVLIFDLGYIFWWSMMRWPSVNFKKQKGSSQNLRIHQERLFSFFELLFYQHA
jgi:hypothetical protein